MNSVFSVDDFSDPFWQSPASAMNRSTSEWALEKFLEEISAPPSASSSANDNNAAAASAVAQSPTSSKPKKVDDDVVEIKKPQISAQLTSDRDAMAVIDSEEYRAYLKSRLDLACAVAAMSRAAGRKPENLSSLAEHQSPAVTNSVLGLQSLGAGHGISMPQNEADGGSVGLVALSEMQQKPDMQAKQTTSGSSRENSDDDEVEGGTETNDQTVPADAKRVRRMQSNRESARRSRRRKQQQLNELETQVGQLRDERTTLLSRYGDINKKCDNAAVDNRILKANIETLRTKVKMAEEQVKRVTGINPMLLARSHMGMPFISGQMDASTNIGVPMQPNSDQLFHQPVPVINSTATHLQRLGSGFPNNAPLVPLATNLPTDNGTSNVGEMSSVQHVQKHLGSSANPDGSLPVCESGNSRAVAKDNKRK